MSTTAQKSGFPWYNTWWFWTIIFVVIYHLLFMPRLVKSEAQYLWPVDLLFAIVGMTVIIYIWRWFNREQLEIQQKELEHLRVIRQRHYRVEAAKRTFHRLTGGRSSLHSHIMHDFVSLQVYKPILDSSTFQEVIGTEEINPDIILNAGEDNMPDSLLLPGVWLIIFKYEWPDKKSWEPEEERSNAKIIVRTVMGLGWYNKGFKDYWTIQDEFSSGLMLCDKEFLMIPVSPEVDKTLLFSFIRKYHSVKGAAFDSIVEYGLPELDPAVEQSDPNGRHKWLRILQAAVHRVAGNFATGLVADRDELERRKYNLS